MEDFGYIKNDGENKLSNLVKKSFLIAATLFSISCFIYITINAYYFVSRGDDKNIQTIKSPEDPIKIIEDLQEEGSKTVDRSIYDDIFGNKKESMKRATAPQAYIAPAAPPSKQEAEKKIQSVNSAPSPVSSSATSSLTQSNLTKTNSAATQNNNSPTIKKDSEGKIIVYSNGVKQEAHFKDVSSKEKPTKIVSNKPKVIRVQIAAMASKTSAQDFLSKTSRLYPQIFSGLKPFIQEVDLGKRGIFYRLQIGDFFNQIAAEEFCGKYVSSAQKSKADCIIVE